MVSFRGFTERMSLYLNTPGCQSCAARVTTLKSLNFRTTFDVYATPKMFLLDRDKKVIAKQVGAEQIAEILAREEEAARSN